MKPAAQSAVLWDGTALAAPLFWRFVETGRPRHPLTDGRSLTSTPTVYGLPGAD
jgi:hypothetical protein